MGKYLDEWMHGWIGKYSDGFMDGWMHGWANIQMD